MDDIYLIDTLNLWHVAKRNRLLAHDSLLRFLYKLEQFAHQNQTVVHCFMDGNYLKNEITESSLLYVHYPSRRQTGDHCMEAWMKQLPQSERLSHWVVTNDNALHNMALGYGLRHQSCDIFLRTMTSS